MWTKEFYPIEFQEHFLKGQLEAKHILFKCKYYITLFIKYGRSTTNRWVHNRTNILSRVIGILHYFIVRLQFLISTIVWNNMAWLNFIIFFILFMYVWAEPTATPILNGHTHLNNNTHKGKPDKFNKFNILFNSVKSKRFYSIKATSLDNYKFNLQENIQDINIEFNEDLKILHSLYIKDLFKDRAAPVIPFDSNLILATCNLGDIKERPVFLKEWGSKGGIYIIEYKYNPLIYYIGRTTLIKRRINNHIKAETNSKFHVFFLI